ncbi:MAG: excinuclease ABC subunit B [Verrucomicrobia bacterium]|nr:excinuclease ABC subunit B [Verrucomicrobiota bacterium]
MFCDFCKKNEAKVHLTQIVEGVTKKVDLCEACSKEKGADDPTGFSLADLLLGLGSAQEAEVSASSDVSCAQCGYTHAEFKKNGRLGCPMCYETFQEQLPTLLKTMHKGVRHVGKVPQSRQHSRELGEKLQELTSRLDAAVAKEDFEQAVVLRDEIKRLKTALTNAPAA